jgi:hypothetical protein
MQAAEVIAQVLGPLYVVVAIGMAARPGRVAEMVEDLAGHPAHCFLWGLPTLGLGLLILAVAGSWRADWTAVVALLGWLATVKGALLIVFPDPLMRLSRGFFTTPARIRAWTAGPLLLGIFLTVFGFGLV